MKTFILDGSQQSDRLAKPIQTALTEALQARGAEVTQCHVADAHIGPCMGDFFCWLKTPGLCSQDDENRSIAQEFLNSDLAIFLTPITFGGYASELKRGVDHLIQNILPFFSMINGEVHHKKRYSRYPRLLIIGWLPDQDITSEAIFQHLVERNSINLFAPSAVCGIIHGDQSPETVKQTVSGWLDSVLNQEVHVKGTLPVDDAQANGEVRVRRALLLIGSPRGKTSSSQALGGYLFDQLAAQHIETETIRLYTVQKSVERQAALFEAVAAADLVLLAFPLYVDSLSAPTIRGLEMIATNRKEQANTHRQLFAAIANCGFPEAGHNRTALAICRDFARQTGFDWAGSLALGAGEGIVHGTPLTELGGQSIPLRHALDMAAKALAVGKSIPPEAAALMAKPIIPGWLYRTIGQFGWMQQAKAYHNTQKQMNARPYEAR